MSWRSVLGPEIAGESMSRQGRRYLENNNVMGVGAEDCGAAAEEKELETSLDGRVATEAVEDCLAARRDADSALASCLSAKVGAG